MSYEINEDGEKVFYEKELENEDKMYCHEIRYSDKVNKMEIKTEKEIWRHVQTEMELRKNNCQTMQEYLNQIEKKWFSVESLIEDLDKYIIPKKDITNQDQALENRVRKRFIKEIIKQLKGEQN